MYMIGVIFFHTGLGYLPYVIYVAKSHLTLLKAKKRKPNKAKKMGYISNERPDQGVFLGI